MSNSTGLSSEQMETVSEALLISGYLNLCFMVAELAVLAHGPKGKFREALDTLAHILAGPISFLGFLNGGFMGSLFFFLSLWHFLCDSGGARPSFVRTCPRNCEEFWIWFESFWLLLHHWYIGAFKLLSTDLASNLQGINTSQGSIRFQIRTWVCGATLSHLSFGMAALDLKGATFARVISVICRMGAALGIVIVRKDQMALRLAFSWDLIWMSVILSLTARKAFCAGKAKTADTTPDHENHPEHEDGAASMQVRLVERIRKRRATRLAGVDDLSLNSDPPPPRSAELECGSTMGSTR